MSETIVENNELRQRIQELEALAELSKAISNILDVEELLHTVLVWTKNQFDLYMVNIALLDPTGKNLIPFLADNDILNDNGLDFQSDVPPIPIIAEPSLCAYVARERKVLVVNDVHVHPDFMPHALLPETESELVLPIIVGEQLIGIVDVQARELNRFSEADVRLFTTLTAQFGIAIQNARAYQLSARRATELTILNEMSQSLNTTAGIDGLLMTFYHYASRLIDTTNFYVAFYEPEEKERGEILFALDVVEDEVHHWPGRRPFGNFLTERIIATKRPLLVECDVPTAFRKLEIDIPAPRCQSWLGVPMIVNDVVTGVVGVQSYTTPNLFNQGSLRLLVSMSNQVSLAIENARLFAKVKEHSQHLELKVAQRTLELTKTNTQLLAEIADRVQAEEALTMYAHELEQSNQALQCFAYVVSHDLQEPLRKITTFGSRLQTKYGDVLDERGQTYLDRMLAAAERMQHFITDLLALSRVSTHMEPFAMIDLNEIVAGVISDLEVRIEETAAAVTYDLLPQIEADPTQIQQLMQNLIGNALKFTRPNVPPKVHVSSELFVEEGREYCHICVADNGLGIEEQYLTCIFEVFERLHSKNEFEGSGVGLAICRKIVERHQGSIAVRSVWGEGTMFVVQLPLHQDGAKDFVIE